MFAGRCHHRDWVSGKYIIQPNSWGWRGGLELGRGLVTGGIAPPPSLPPTERGSSPLLPQKRGDGLEDATCKTPNTLMASLAEG